MPVPNATTPCCVCYQLLLDTGSKSYQGVIVLTHTMSNPVMNVAIWLMADDAFER